MAEAAVEPPTLHEWIRRAREEWSGIERDNAARFERLGRILREIYDSKLVPKGRWQKFIRATFDFSPEAARRWMLLAKRIDAEPKRKFKHLSDVNPAWSGPTAGVRLRALREENAAYQRRFHAERMGRFRAAQETDADRTLKRELHDEIVSLGYREASKKRHPDRGGSTRAMTLLTEVRDRMMRCMYCGYRSSMVAR
jgi:hypothetical protein